MTYILTPHEVLQLRERLAKGLPVAPGDLIMLCRSHEALRPKKKDVVLVKSDDWCGLYVNDHIVAQGHQILPADYNEVVIGATSFIDVRANDLWLHYCGDLPENLAGVVKETDEWEPPKDTELEFGE